MAENTSKSFKLIEMVRFTTPDRTLPDALADARLREVVATWVRNVDRACYLANLPIGMIGFGSLLQRHIAKSLFNVTGDHQANVSEDPQLREKVWLEGQRLLDLEGLGELPPQFAFELLKVFDRRRFDRDNPIDHAVQSLLSAVLIGVWTAFETLAGDLWEAAINAHPEGLAELKGRENRIANTVKTKIAQADSLHEIAGKGDASSDSSKVIRLKDLQRLTGGTYNLGDKMGTLLKVRYKFTTLTGIRNAYSAAFDKHPEAIVQALGAPCLDALAMVRNLLVHKGGIADAVYVEVSGSIPSAPRLVANEELRFDGEIVRVLADPVLRCCVDLVKAVDSYIKTR